MPQHQLSFDSIAIVGGGKMGEAILSGLLRAQTGVAASITAENMVVVNPGELRRRHLQKTYSVECVESIAQLSPCTFVILAVKPQVMPSVLDELAACSWLDGVYVLSIAAGISTSTYEAALPRAHVLRAMPNTPLTVACGVVAICTGKSATQADAAAVQDLFKALGQAVVVNEEQMDAVTAVSGSGPAYVAALIEAMASAGAELGLDPTVAEELARATAEGTAVLLRETGQGAAKTRQDVCSPGGTTLAALDAMEHAGYTRSIHAGVHAAAVRSKELSQ